MATKAKNSAGNKPVTFFKAKGVKVSVFENVAKNGDRDVKFYKTTVQKFYKDGEDFKVTQSLGRDDLPVVRHLLQKAWEFILEAESNQKAEDSE